MDTCSGHSRWSCGWLHVSYPNANFSDQFNNLSEIFVWPSFNAWIFTITTIDLSRRAQIVRVLGFRNMLLPGVACSDLIHAQVALHVRGLRDCYEIEVRLAEEETHPSGAMCPVGLDNHLPVYFKLARTQLCVSFGAMRCCGCVCPVQDRHRRTKVNSGRWSVFARRSEVSVTLTLTYQYTTLILSIFQPFSDLDLHFVPVCIGIT